jgi:D-3-phosphoglycerate dehydrogenase
MAFRIGLTRDYLVRNNRPAWPGLGVDGFEDETGLEISFLPEPIRLAPAALIDQYDALLSSTVRYTAESFAGVERLAVIARFGVGYDTVDLEAATRAGVLVTITRGAADRPVAEGALTLMLALGHQVVNKDRLTRAGRWDERQHWVGVELRDRVVGVIGFGGIGRELFRLLGSFGIARALAYDPYADPDSARERGVELVPLETLLQEADFISIHCPLTEETRGLLGERKLSLLKRTAFLINTARGPVVDQEALTRALEEGRLRGAALDVFQEEPIRPDDPLLRLENVIVTPHYVAVTEELFRDYHRSCAEAILAVKRGEVPRHVVNPEVIGTPPLERKLARLRERDALP